ncbi:MAG: NAD-dependent protein deacylase [Coriobacteriia bacterium]|nr:NAD-dependent protein deacylase [Coriobacteriia bacterium]
MSASNEVKLLRKQISEASPKSIVFFGGAGVSTASGIPDFRSAEGIFTKYGHLSPERLVSASYFRKDPEGFFDFYRSKLVYAHAEPNAAHLKLVELERDGMLSAVVTQNVDGLHQKAGSENVLELHGSMHHNYCLSCKQTHSLAFVMQAEGVPHCEECGGTVRPHVVLYEEALDEALLERAAALIAGANMLIIGGTSLAVFPAAGLVRYFSGEHLVIINHSSTPQDSFADLCIREDIAEVFSW